MSANVDLFGRCNNCGHSVESTGGCQRCWSLSTWSEAVRAVMTMPEPAYPNLNQLVPDTQVVLVSDPLGRETVTGRVLTTGRALA